MKNILIGIVVIFVVIILYFAYQTFAKGGFSFGKTTKVQIGNETFTAEIAKTSEEQQIGLSKKTSLGEKNGMLFPFDTPSYYGFWMKNMKFPIDIIYIREKKIVTIFPHVPNPKSESDSTPVYTPTEPADTVLELHDGATEKYNIKVGDSVKIDNF